MKDDYRHTGSWNSFRFEPEILHDDLLKLSAHARELGYTLLFRDAGYTLEEVQTTLRERGPSAYLDLGRLREDISPRGSTKTVEEFVGERLAVLAPKSELVITDPYVFTSSRKRDAIDYADSVARIISPLLVDGAALTLVFDARASHDSVKEAVIASLVTLRPSAVINLVESDDFHDRFWIADRARGIILGSSLNKIFFIDALSKRDVQAVLEELDQIQKNDAWAERHPDRT